MVCVSPFSVSQSRARILVKLCERWAFTTTNEVLKLLRGRAPVETPPIRDTTGMIGVR